METPIAQPDAGTADGDARRLRNGLISTVALVLLLGGIAIAVPSVHTILRPVEHAQPAWLLIALALEVGSCLGYVAVVRLVMHRYPAREVRWLAWAEMAFGAVVPVGGAGGLAVGAWAMRAWGVPWNRIANRSAVIFLLTTAVNAAVLILAGVGLWVGLGAHGGFLYGLLPALVTAAGLALFLALPRSPRLANTKRFGSLAKWVSDTEKVAFAADRRLLGAAGYLLFDIAALYASLRAVGQTPPVLALIVGYQIGYLANLVPIPGAIGVLEGGLFGALVLYGLPATSTAAAVVLYHAIALWVPAIGGTAGFARLRRSVMAARPLRAIAGGVEAPAPAAIGEIAA